MDYRFERAEIGDAAAIAATLAANRDDPSLFQQTEAWLRRRISDFVVVRDDSGAVVGCAEIAWHRPDNVEILAVAVAPAVHGRGVGTLLMRSCVSLALARNPHAVLWLGTKKPEYFARFGFAVMSMWRLPIPVLLHKLRLVFQQPAGRWLPNLLGASSFMRWSP